MRVRIKICGVTTPDAVSAAVDAGADAVGFVFSESPRRVTIEQAIDLAALLPPFVGRVAVFHHPTPQELQATVSRFGPTVIQTEIESDAVPRVPEGSTLLPVFHDDQHILKHVAETRQRLGGFSAVLLEAAGRGGRGIAPNWDHAAIIARQLPLVLAGGLSVDNVARAIQRVRPYAVDVSSGVEASTGVKDPELIAGFVRAARSAKTHTRSSTEASS